MGVDWWILIKIKIRYCKSYAVIHNTLAVVHSKGIMDKAFQRVFHNNVDCEG